MRRVIVLVLLLLFACSRAEKRVIFVGLDGADWRLLDRLMADGTMPELAKILERAERRVLLTQHPPLSPLVWTSMMTGTSPLEHRILDFTRFHPVTRQQEPITSDERERPAIWNMAVSRGKKVGVFGMWATYPPEPGVVLTDRDLPRDYVQATEVVHERAVRFVREEKPQLAIVYFQGTDEIGHFTSGDVEKARAYYARIDKLLGEYRELAGELIIASDHGFDWGGTHEESSTATATAAKWHRNEGVFVRWPRERATLDEARVDQIGATLLDALGLPKGEGIAEAVGGSTIAETYNYRRAQWRAAAPGGSGAAEGGGAPLSDEAVAKLKALGYLGSTAAAPKNVTGTRTPQSFNNEGLLLREAQRVDDAEKAFAQALAIDPRYASARRNLDDLLATRGVERLKARDCQGALNDLRNISVETPLLWASIAAAEGCLGNDEAAEQAVRRSLELNPDQPELRRLVLH